MVDLVSIAEKYAGILHRYFQKEEEKAFFQVSELAKELVNKRVGPDILLDIHNQCLKKFIESLDALAMGRIVINANEVLLNGIMAYAMNYYNFMDILDAQKKELEEANLRLKEVDRLKSMFIASMSHELRTPLNSVIGFSSILLKEWAGPLNEEQKQNLAIVLKAGKHLLSLINDVIDVSKIEAGMVECKIEKFDLEEAIWEAVNLFIKEIEEKGLDLRVEISHQPMHTDRGRLFQCLLNLLKNAVNFTEKGAIWVRTNSKREAKSLASVKIAIEDTGIGIKEEDRSKLFQPFTRLDSPLKSKVLGTGLGLYLTRKIVKEILRGEISVESKYGKGSVFLLQIPAFLESHNS